MPFNYIQGTSLMTYRKYYAKNEKENTKEYMERMVAEVAALEELSMTHIRWYTHKNPRGCWICDIFYLLRVVIGEIEQLTSIDHPMGGEQTKLLGPLDKLTTGINSAESVTEADKANG